ncbi:MAG: threonylcarbamoyl-AMP synthase [Dehalococcoidales bacterium]|nr:MAG: threonylcarbamoyl-AMP synthase [Dehalococcoidales bacterium]
MKGTEPTADIKIKIEEGIKILKRGGIVAYPTDTVYGLGACADNYQAVKRIYEVKNRPMDMPLPLLVSDTSWIERLTPSISETAQKLIDSFMPGALTLVMKKADSVPDIISGGKETIALRIPGHPVTIALIKGIESPLIGTSANLSGNNSALTADEVRSQLGDEIDYILDAGRCPGGIESTILDLTREIPVVLREGAIPAVEIDKVCKLNFSGEEKGI